MNSDPRAILATLKFINIPDTQPCVTSQNLSQNVASAVRLRSTGAQEPECIWKYMKDSEHRRDAS
jgi:hypothetical protein